MQLQFCVVSDFPVVLEAETVDGRLVAHCESGPSHLWADGFAIWTIHGVRVDEQIVLRPETQTIEQIDGEANAEAKRIRIERFGWPRYLKEANAKVIDFRRNDIDATDESLMQAKDGSRLLVCACPSTARIYAMRVERTIETCEQAQRWLYGDRNVRIIGAS
jgi:hypothetical protein